MRLEELRTHWEAWGRLDPFWAILTVADKRGRRWRPGEFFETGRGLVALLLDDARAAAGPLRTRRALDFGCGVGRLTQALASHFESCDGVDISASMVDLARRYNRHGARCRYHVNDVDDLRLFDSGSFDFVLSVIALQHIRPRHSLLYVQEFVRLLAPGGVAVFQLPARRISTPLRSVCEGPLDERAFRARIAPLRARVVAAPGERLNVPVEVENLGAQAWPATAQDELAYSVHLGNHWRVRDGALLTLDDGRAPLARDLEPGETARLELRATAPAVPGRYWLEFDMVQEAVCWFEQRGSATARVPVEVAEPTLAWRLRRALRRLASAERRAPPDMEMHAAEPARVEQAVAEAGGRVLARHADDLAGEGWLSFHYVVARAEAGGSVAA